jgi:hypothetical protein
MTTVLDEPTPQRRRPRWWHVVACTLAVLLLAEGGVRAVSGSLQEPRTWHNWETENKVASLDRLAKQGGASVVFIGSSQMNAQLDPEQFRDERDDPRPPFNAAINGSDPRMQELWIRHVVVPRLKPSVIVIGLTSRDLNDAVRPTQYNLFSRAEATRALTGDLSLLERLERRVERYSELFRYREGLRRPVEAAEGGDEREEQASVTDLGVLDAIVIYSTPRYQFTPEFERRMKRDSGRRFRTGGAQVAALERTLAFLRREGITTVIVNNPVTPDAFTILPGGRESHASYKETLARVAAEFGADLVDLEPLFTGTTGFADPYHVNFDGRTIVTRALAERLPPATQ